MTPITSISHLGLVESRIIGSIAGGVVVLCLVILQLARLKRWQRILVCIPLICALATFIFMVQVVQRTVHK